MSFTTLASRKTLTLQNKNRHINRIKFNPQDYSCSNPIEKLNRLKIDLESASVATTLQETKAQIIETIFAKKEPLMKIRNKIVDKSIALLIFPSYRKKLKAIDEELDNLDLQLYFLETENRISQSELDAIVQNAETRLEKYRELLSPKQSYGAPKQKYY